MKAVEPAVKQGTDQKKLEQAIALEREAHRLRTEGRIDQAFQVFDQAARFFQEMGDPLKSAVCYASAATCWNIHTGRQPLKNAATRNELAAVQAFAAGDYAYAENLFSEASLLYEKEGDNTKYSYCYVRAKDARLRSMWDSFVGSRTKPKEGVRPAFAGSAIKRKTVLGVKIILSLASRIVWGHGERPFRTFSIAIAVIIMSAVVYYFSGLVLFGGTLEPAGFIESLYFSVVTYTTVGFGDYLPYQWTRAIAAGEALSGILLTPLFLIALTRRYLRIDR